MWDRIVEIIGFDNAERLRQEFGGGEIYIPIGRPKEELIPIVREMLKTNSYRAVAKKLNLSVNTVWRYSLM